MMHVELAAAGPRDVPVLENLMQLYKYDFSEFEAEDVDRDGRFPFVGFGSFFAMRDPHAYLVRVDGNLAGFALAYRDHAFRNPTEPTWWMHEFFVMRAYRRRGVGERVATQLFETLGGTWEIGQVPDNVGAQAFWRTIVGRYTGGDYEEFVIDDERWRGPVQYFRSDGRTR